MATGNAIRGTRVGSGPMGESERGESAARTVVSFWCSNGHETHPSFAVDAEIPTSWDCPRCGMPATVDSENRPTAPKTEPYKTHLAYVKERRSEDEADDILTEALDSLRKRRKSGDVIF